MKGIKFSTYNLLTAAFILLICSSCRVNKFLEEDDYLVTDNQVVLDDPEKVIKEKSQLKYELSTLILQEPNSKLFFFKPELYWYFNGLPKKEKKERKFNEKFDKKEIRHQNKINKKNDKILNSGNEEKQTTWNEKIDKKRGLVQRKKIRRSKIRDFFKRKFTEEPVLYDKTVMEETAVSMQNYLKNKGYFDAAVYPSNQLKRRKKAHITYTVAPGNLYTVDTLILESKDPTLDSLIAWLSQETHLTKGAPIDISLYNQEVGRITDSMRNNGYAYFFPNNIKKMETDTTGYGYGLTIYDELLKPFEGDTHRRYRFGNINVYPNFKGELGVVHQDSFLNGIHYKTLDGDIGVKEKLLRRNIIINKGDLYNQSELDDVNRQLNSLGIYQFVNIRTTDSATEDGMIDINIILSKLKKQNITIDADINNSDRFLTNRRNIFFGNSLNISYLNKNTFNAAEKFGVSLEGGVEFNLSDPSALINSLDLSLGFDMRLPEFVDVPGTWKFLSLLKFKDKYLIGKSFQDDMRSNGIPTGRFSVSTFRLLNFYSYNSAELSWSYDLKRSPRENYKIKTIGLTLFQSQTEPAFDTIIMNNNLLRQRLGSRLITGLFYNEFNYLWSSPQNNLGETWQWRFNHELSGAEALLANYIFKGGKQAFNLPLDLEFAHYTKFEIDIRYFKQFRDRNILGIRADLGVAVPFSQFSQTVPFVKQFFVGGPNSIRAWSIRELGPGEFQQVGTQSPFFQTADFKFAFNMEYRFKFIPFLNMDAAVFLDGGNIWTLREDPNRVGSQLLWRPKIENGMSIGDNFIDQIALGTGFGVRVDFTYFVLTVDVGLKLLSPFELPSGSRWYFDQYNRKGILGVMNPNLLFGYPF